MRYIRVRESNGAAVVSSCRITPRLYVLAVTFASACVPTADLSSYSSAASNATADLEEGRTPPPTRPPITARPDEEAPDPTLDDLSPGESVAGSGAPLDPGETGDPPSGSMSGEEDSETAIEGTADAGPRPEAGPPPFVPPPPDAEPPRPLACGAEEKTGPNGRCYVLVATLLDWDAARANCQARGDGWNLTSIRSATDSTFLSSFLGEEAWVGGSDAVTEETWAWVDDGFQFWQGEGSEGEPLNGAFVNWFDDEPNGSASSDCMRLLVDSRWADLECTELRPSVCQGPPS
jgi:hypothetical protein